MKNKTAQTQFTKKKRIKNFTLEILGATILSAGLYACSNDNETTDNSTSTTIQPSGVANKISYLNNSTDLVSDLFFNLGVEEIEVIENLYNIKTFKHFNFRGTDYDMKNFSFFIQNDVIYLNDGIGLSLVKEELVIEGELKELRGEDFANIEVGVLSMIKYEVLLSVDNKISSDKRKTPINIGAPCSFSNTYYCVGFGLTNSAAQADCDATFASYEAAGSYIGCEVIGNKEPVGGTFGFLWAFTLCCS